MLSNLKKEIMHQEPLSFDYSKQDGIFNYHTTIVFNRDEWAFELVEGPILDLNYNRPDSIPAIHGEESHAPGISTFHIFRKGVCVWSIHYETSGYFEDEPEYQEHCRNLYRKALKGLVKRLNEEEVK